MDSVPMVPQHELRAVPKDVAEKDGGVEEQDPGSQGAILCACVRLTERALTAGATPIDPRPRPGQRREEGHSSFRMNGRGASRLNGSRTDC